MFATARTPEDIAALEADGLEAFHLDYTDEASIAALVEDVAARTGGRIDALFNNGAYGQPGAVEDVATDVLRAQFEANVFGWHALTLKVLPFMRAQGHGRIVQCSSILGLLPYRYRGPYSASKYALEALSLTLRMELDGTGIFVSLIEPGPIASRFTANALKHIHANIDLEGSHHAAEYRKQLARLSGSGPENKSRLEPDAVHAVLKKALSAKRPRPHYPVTTPAKQGMLLKRVMPSDWFYRLMGRLS